MNRENELNNLIELLERILNFEKWIFHRVYTQLRKGIAPTVIYDSKLCRVQFVLESGERYQGARLSVYYGRLHAASDNFDMVFNGESSHCWHQVQNLLNFLDGLSPQESVDQLKIKNQWSRIQEEYKQSDVGKNLESSNHPEWMARMHQAIWEYYGNRFFELFDIKNPTQWEKYVSFNREYHKIYGSTNWVIPPLDKIC